MEWLPAIAMIVIIFFVCALLAATAYVLWFAIKNGIWDAFEKDVLSMVSQAEKNANALGALISREFSSIEDKVVTTYKTVAATLTETASIIKSKGDDTIMVIKTGGDDAISKIERTFNTLVNDATGATKAAISTVETTATDTIEKIITTSNTSVASIKTAYSTVQSTLLDTSKTVSDRSNAIIKEMTDSVRAAYAAMEKAGKDSYTTVETSALEGVNEIKAAGATISSTTTSVVNEIKENGDRAINTITSKSLEVIAQLRDGTVRLAQQIADDAAAAAAKAEAAAREAATTVATGATDAANTVATGATGVANTVSTGATGVANTVATGATDAAGRLTGVRTTPATPAPGAVSGFQNYREGFQVSQATTVSLEESMLFNLQPLSIKDTGFLGPYPKGSYKPEIATANVLKAGCRFLTLQIDYTDLKMNLSLFEVPGLPTLLIRGPDGKLMSKNSGSINDVATTIANTAFNPIVPNNRMPVILYLHLVRAPSSLNDPDGYLSFLSKIADALNPLAPFHLSLTPQGNFTRQKMAEELLTMPMSSLEGQVIILSNADTSIFRAGSINKSEYPPAKDLDFWVNMRVYLDDPSDLNGITQIADDAIVPTAVLVDLNRILGLSSIQKEAFAAKGKRRYVIAMGKRTTNPTPAELNIALNNLGVNVIPIDIFTDTDKNILLLSNEYANKSFRQKPMNLQYR